MTDWIRWLDIADAIFPIVFSLITVQIFFHRKGTVGFQSQFFRLEAIKVYFLQREKNKIITYEIPARLPKDWSRHDKSVKWSTSSSESPKISRYLRRLIKTGFTADPSFFSVAFLFLFHPNILNFFLFVGIDRLLLIPGNFIRAILPQNAHE